MNVSIHELWRSARGRISPVPVRALLAVAPRLSMSKVLLLGRWLGIATYYISPKHRRRALQNLQIAFGEGKSCDERRRIAKRAFQDFAKTGLESLCFHSMPKSVLMNRVAIEGREHLDKALERGGGVIGLTAHFGNFLALHGRLGIEGYPVNAVVKALRDKAVEDLMLSMRTGVGVKTIYVRPSIHCIRSCQNALTSNELVVLLNDQPQKNGVLVDFFGAPVLAAAGPASLALATRAAVIPMFAIRGPDDMHRVVIGEPVRVVRTNDRKRDIIVNTQAFNKITEAYVSLYPELWAWNQRRWRSWGDDSTVDNSRIPAGNCEL